jgi:hypothetical protein
MSVHRHLAELQARVRREAANLTATCVAGLMLGVVIVLGCYAAWALARVLGPAGGAAMALVMAGVCWEITRGWRAWHLERRRRRRLWRP